MVTIRVYNPERFLSILLWQSAPRSSSHSPHNCDDCLARCVQQPRARRTLLNLAPGASLLHIFHLIHNFHNFCLFHNFHLIYLIHILHLIHLTPCQLMLLLLSVLCIIYCGGWLTMTVMNSNMKHGNCCVLCYFSWQSAIFWREIHKTQGRSYIIQYSADSSWSGPSPDSGKNLDDLHHTLVGHPTPGSKERCESEIILDVLWSEVQQCISSINLATLVTWRVSAAPHHGHHQDQEVMSGKFFPKWGLSVIVEYGPLCFTWIDREWADIGQFVGVKIPAGVSRARPHARYIYVKYINDAYSFYQSWWFSDRNLLVTKWKIMGVLAREGSSPSWRGVPGHYDDRWHWCHDDRWHFSLKWQTLGGTVRPGNIPDISVSWHLTTRRWPSPACDNVTWLVTMSRDLASFAPHWSSPKYCYAAVSSRPGTLLSCEHYWTRDSMQPNGCFSSRWNS